MREFYEIGSTKTAACQVKKYVEGTHVYQVWPVIQKGMQHSVIQTTFIQNIDLPFLCVFSDPQSEEIIVSFWAHGRNTRYTAVKSTQVRTFEEVKAYCDQFGMKMPVPQSEAECKELKKLADPRP